MSKAEKALEKILSGKSDANVTLAEISRALKLKGWKLDRIKGSHHMFTKDLDLLSIPVHGDPIKPIYIKKTRQFLK